MMTTPPAPPPPPTPILKPSSGPALALEEEQQQQEEEAQQQQQQQQREQQNPPNTHSTLIIHNNDDNDDDSNNDNTTKMSILPPKIDLPRPAPPAHPPPQPPPAATPPRTTCQSCGAQEKFFLHNVQIKGEIQRLCTSCVLVEHPKSFCASCFAIYDPSPRPPPSKRIRCSTCSSSFVHSHCAPSHPFVCPRCSKPNFSFFDLSSNSKRSITKPMASALLCAAKIAHSSMVKAAASARDDALTKVTNAASSRKRARAALEHVASLSIKHQQKLVKALSSKKDQLSAAAVITLTNHPQIANGKSTFSGFDGSNNNNNNGSNNGVKIPTFHRQNASAAAATNSNHNNGNANDSAVKVKEECDNVDGGGGGGSNGVLNS